MNIRTGSYGTRCFREIGSLAESDMLGMYGTGDLQPEKRLMFAILLDAVDCFQEHAKDDRLVHQYLPSPGYGPGVFAERSLKFAT